MHLNLTFVLKIMELEENTLKLISLYKSHPILWDINASPSNKTKSKAEIYNDIAKEMNATVEMVKKKIHSLRAAYTTEKRRMERILAKNYSSKMTEQYYPSFKCFYLLNFLDSVDCSSKTETISIEEHERKRSRKEDENRLLTDNKKKRKDIQPAAEDEEKLLKFNKYRVKRYMVKIPKTLLTIKTADAQELRQRYTALGIPSDFFLANIKWSDIFTPDKPFSIKRPCQFHIMHDMVESPTEQDDLSMLLEPADANCLYTAKVMLLALPPIDEFYKKCFPDDNDSAHNPIHLWRLMNFLVGVEGNVQKMAIGGPWSASLDGENPDKDPDVLIRTAKRTCKALTGINLSNCTKWYRFLEIYYHRQDGKEVDDYVETVVIYLPDVHSLMPSQTEWDILNQVYKNTCHENDKLDNFEINSKLNQKAVIENFQDGVVRNGMTPTVLIYDKTDDEVNVIDDDNDEREEATVYSSASSLDVEDIDVEKLKDSQNSKFVLSKKVRSSLPLSPHVIVRPNRLAKGGKFDCVIKSLADLLDYPCDLKESSFEISLFAELFNDMLMHDFGFYIYKEINQLKEPETTLEQNGTHSQIKQELIDIDDEENKSLTTFNGYKSDKNQKNNYSTAAKLQTSSVYKNIINPDLLLAFIYFDTTQCGYIIGKDLEDLFKALGLNLMPSQLSELLQTLNIIDPSDPIHYRILTHLEEEDEEFTPAIEVVNMANFEPITEIEVDDSDEEEPLVISSEEDSSYKSDSFISAKLSDKEIVLALIEEYSEIPQLLNTTLEEVYELKRKNHNSNFYQTLTNNLNERLKLKLSTFMVRKKLTFLCDQYEKEIERRLSTGKNPSTASQWLFDKMRFLEPLVEIQLKHKMSQSKYLPIPLDDHHLYDLIDVYKDYKKLWNTKDLTFFDRKKRAELMQSLLNEVRERMNLSLTMSQLEKQLSYIHKSYSKDKKLRLECEINEIAFRPTFPYFYQSHFLEPHESPFKCPDCNFITKSDWLLKKHKSKHVASKPYKCSKCGKEYDYAGYYQDHIKKHLKHLKKKVRTSKFCCKACPEKFDSQKQLDSHVSTHERLCNICGASFTSEKNFRIHMKLHEEKHKYFCFICQEGFFLKISLHNHIKQHTELNDKICDICNKTFSDVLYLYRHKQRVHGIQFNKK